MNLLKMALICSVTLASAACLAQSTNCEEGAGPLNPAQPQGMNTQQIIEKFATQEAVFKQARDNYTFTQDITVQELDGNMVSGEFRLVEDIVYDDKGNRIENVTFAPQSGLRQLTLTKEDYEDFRNRTAFVVTSEEVPHYNLLYVGRQHIDEIDAYVFDIAPKTLEKGRRYFQGRLWVEDHEFNVVKTCGKTVPEVRADNHKKKNVDENLSPTFVTYREQIDGTYWFPTYTRADETLHFRIGDIKMREIIKYTNYKRFGSTTRITFKGEVKDKDEKAPPAKKP